MQDIIWFFVCKSTWSPLPLPTFKAANFQKIIWGDYTGIKIVYNSANESKWRKFRVNQTWMWVSVWLRTLLFAVIFVVKNQRTVWEENHFRCEKKVVGSVGNSGAGQSEVWDIVRKSQVDLVKPQNSYTLPFCIYLSAVFIFLYFCIYESGHSMFRIKWESSK